MPVTVTPETFTMVSYDAARIRELTEEVAAKVGLDPEVDIHVAIDETTPLGVALIASLAPITLTLESGAVEDPKAPRQLSDEGAQNVLGRLLFEAAAELGAHHIKVGNIPGAPCPPDRLAEAFAEICADAAQHTDAKVAYEFMPFDVNVRTFIAHTFAADVDMTVVSPAGTVVTLTTDNGAGNDNVFDGTLWDDQANPGGQVPYTTNAGIVTDNPYVNGVVASPLAPEEPLPALLAKADAKKGAQDAKICQTCHNFDKGAGAKIGPPLYGVVGRPIASVAGFAYSDSLKGVGGNWTYEEISKMITNPKSVAADTKMTFPGEKDAQRRADILAYLQTLSDSPVPFPK